VTVKTIRLFAAALGLSAGAWLTATAREPLPTGVTDKLIEGDIAFLQKQLDKATPEKRALPTIKATALLLAVYAQDNLVGVKAEAMAGLRAAALKVADAVAKKDYAAAKAAAAGLKDAKGGDAKPLDLSKQGKISLEEVMSAFRKGTVGGRNIEADLKAQAKSLSDVGLAAEIGGRSAAIAHLTESLPLAGTTGAKAKQWTDLTKEMKDLGTKLATEAGKDKAADKKKVTELLNKLEKNCTDCHKVFRD
jgi:hypothetical protein